MSYEIIIRNFNVKPVEGALLGGALVEGALVEGALSVLETACTRPPARAPDRPSSTR
jgi:hypothetical protein